MTKSPGRAIWPDTMTRQPIPLALAPAIAAGDFVFVTGMTGSTPDGSMPGDPETQYRAAFAKIDTILRADGLDLSHIVEMTSYHIDIQSTFDAFAAVQAELMQAARPAWTAIGIAQLRRPGALVEIKVTAYRGSNAPDRKALP
ncbi:MAG: RidA family protein [Pseudomonadota bacterium]